MSPTPRVHGGPDAEGVAEHDFSTNANACGPCPAAFEAVRAADATRYPDPAYTELRSHLARHHGVAVERIVPAASASEFIFRMTAWAHSRGIQEVVVPVHGYGDYRQAALAVGCGLATALPGPASLVWACDPSSPLGAADGTLEAALDAGASVVLDRAYEPVRLDSATCERPDALWQLWSPNKALGLTGVRAAYAIAPVSGAQDVRELEALAPSWLLGAHGVALLHAWCEPATQQWLRASRATLAAWKTRQQTLCRELGWDVLPSAANFFVAKVPDLEHHLPRLRRQGVKLRDCASFGLPGHARLAVLPPASQDALARAWREGASAEPAEARP